MRHTPTAVMPGLDPGIHVLRHTRERRRGWPGRSPAMTERVVLKIEPVASPDTVIPRCAIAHRGCATRTRVYPSSAISLSKSATADLDAQARNPYSRSWLWVPGSLASLAPRNDGLCDSRESCFHPPQPLQLHHHFISCIKPHRLDQASGQHDLPCAQVLAIGGKMIGEPCQRVVRMT